MDIDKKLKRSRNKMIKELNEIALDRDDYKYQLKECRIGYKALRKKIEKLEADIKVYKNVVKENLKCIGELKMYNANKGKLITELKQNQFKVIAEGEVDILYSKIDVRIGNEFIIRKFIVYQGQKIQLGVKEVK